MAQTSKRLGRVMTSGRNHLGLLALLAIYLAVTLAYGLLNPLGEAPDEMAHVTLIRFISEEEHLPRNAAERQAAGYKSDWPMLYHTLIGMGTRWIDYDTLPQLKTNDASPRRLLIEDGLSPSVLVHTDDEAFPYQGIVSLWHLARLASTLLSAGTLAIIYSIILAVRPGNRQLALGAAAATAAIPQFHFIASAVNDDNLLGLLSALLTLALVRAWQRPRLPQPYIWAGVWLGLALTTKYSVALLPLLVVAVLAYAVRRGRLGWRTALSRLILFGATMAITAAWWFIYLERYFVKAKEHGIAIGLINLFGSDHSTQGLVGFITSGKIQLPSPSQSDAKLSDWAATLFRSFWFVEGQADATVVTVFSLAFLGMCCLAVLGIGWARRRGDDLPWPLLGLFILQIGLLLPLPLLRFYMNFNPAETGQGRHVLFPAAAAVGLLLTLGVSAWFPPARRHFAGPALAGTLLVISLVSFIGFVMPAFPPRLPVRTSTNAAKSVQNSINVSFSDEIELVNYQVGEVNQNSALPVTLIWQSLGYSDQDYLVELALLDEEGRVRSLWLGHPVNGRYPTRAWDPGDVVRDSVWLPLPGLEAGTYRLRLRLRSSSDLTQDTDLPPTEEAGALLASVAIPALPARSPAHTFDLPSGHSVGIDVWQAGDPTEGMPIYRYRAAIPITLLRSQISDLESQVRVSLVGPNGVEQTTQAQIGDTHIFLVDAFWPSGEYSLRVQGIGEAIESKPILRAQVRPRNFVIPPMSTEVRANFGGDILLLGFDFPERRAQPGDALPITLYWQAQRPTTGHYVVSNHLLNSADLHQWGGRDRVPQVYYSTAVWTPGEVVRDDYLVPVDPGAPSGVYRLDIGLYAEVAGQASPIPLVADGESLDANSVTIAPIKIGGPPPGVTVQNPSPQHPRADNLGGLVTLLGYDLSLETGALNLILYWRCDAPLPADYTTFVHVRDAGGQVTGQAGDVLAQMDRPPANGAYPTSLWDAGEVIRDPIQVPLPAEVPPGEYEIVVGLYDFATGNRLPVTGSMDGSVTLTEIAR